MEDVLDFTQDLVECVNNDTKVWTTFFASAKLGFL
jgi:hypothetical protein